MTLPDHSATGLATRSPVLPPRRALLRIAIFSYGLPVEGEKRGGVDRVAHDLAQGLALRGHQITVWSYDPRPADAAYEVRPLPWRRVFESWLGNRLTYGYLGNLIALLPDYGEVDAVVAMGDSLLLPLRGRPVLRMMHGSALGEALTATSPLRFAAQMGVYAQELLTAVLSPACVGVSQSTCRHNPFVRVVIPNGVDLSSFHPDPSVRAAEPTVLFVGTMQGRKRGHLLLDWFARHVRPRFPTARLVVVGPPGPEAPGVEYRTGVSKEELGELYRQAWVYATPSSYEGFGLPYVEAMASGTPVIATPNPGSEEVLDGGSFGVLVSDERFGPTLARLLGDAEWRAELTERGLQRAETYALERMVDAYERLLVESVVGGS